MSRHKDESSIALVGVFFGSGGAVGVISSTTQQKSCINLETQQKSCVNLETQQKSCEMIPPLNSDGNLPPGVHCATWQEFAARFGTTPHRQRLLKGLKSALDSLSKAGCQVVYIDGSFVTEKENPNDYDGCWDITGVDPYLLDPILLNFDNDQAAQKIKYLGELFPAQTLEGITGKTFLNFFQVDKNSGNPKGIVAINLGRI